MIPIDSIEMPAHIVALCNEWHSGVNCKLYAVSSTGGLTLGNRRPGGCDTPEKWYLHIWEEFAGDLGYARRMAKAGRECGADRHPDEELLEEAEEWADSVCDSLRGSYGLEDWDV